MMVFKDYTFIIVALGCLALGALSGVIGSFAVLRRESLLGDGVSHSALPGVVAAFLLTGIKDTVVLLIGALFSGLLSAVLISFAVKKTKIRFDAALATVMSSFFGFGTVLLTCAQKLPDATQAGLSAFIYGQASSMLKSDVVLILVSAFFLLLMVMLFWKEFKVFSFDKEFAAQLGYHEKPLSLILSFMTVITVILGIRTVGVVLMSAMLISPAAAARQWSDRLSVMVILAAFFGGMSGVLGVYASTVGNGLPTGPAIVIASGVMVMLSILFAPKRGVLSHIIKRRMNRLRLTVTIDGENRDTEEKGEV